MCSSKSQEPVSEWVYRMKSLTFHLAGVFSVSPLSHTHTHTHTTHTLFVPHFAFTLSLSLSLSLSLHTCTHSSCLTASLRYTLHASLTQPHTHTYTLSHSHSLTHAHTFSPKTDICKTYDEFKVKADAVTDSDNHQQIYHILMEAS